MARHGCAYKTIVKLENRTFIVEYDDDGNVLRIKERKNKQPPMIGVYEASWWTAKSHVLGAGLTMPKRVIEMARQKMAAEDVAHNATP